MAKRFRTTLAIMLAAASLLLLGARCVEHDALVRGDDGNWHVYGELFNETDIQGVDLIVQASIFDANGNLLGTATSPTCPGALSPGKPVVYDITFAGTEGTPKPASYKINVVNGAVLATPLLELDVVPTFEAYESGDGDKVVTTLPEGAAASGAFFQCLALYDPSGNVIAVIDKSTSITTEGTQTLRRTRYVDSGTYPDAATARVWVWRVKPTGEASQPAVSPYLRLKPLMISTSIPVQGTLTPR
jgi:hypothetical protein